MRVGVAGRGSGGLEPDSTRAALDALAAIEGNRRIAVLGAMLELGDDSDAEHRNIGMYAASRADIVVAVDETARSIAFAAEEGAVVFTDNDAAIDWLRRFARRCGAGQGLARSAP